MRWLWAVTYLYARDYQARRDHDSLWLGAGWKAPQNRYEMERCRAGDGAKAMEETATDWIDRFEGLGGLPRELRRDLIAGSRVVEVPAGTQVFAPGQNWGALETPGCVTYRDEYLPRGRLTDRMRASRALELPPPSAKTSGHPLSA